jgi:GNAT superfamily N-acetyltransferase
MPHDEVHPRDPTFARMPDHLARMERGLGISVSAPVDQRVGGVNRFSPVGEALFATDSVGQIVGVCGLNVDPYLDDPGVGRLGNVYVLAAFRGRGIGRRLVEQAIPAARGHFHRLLFRGEEAVPARLCELLRYRPCNEIPSCTHILDLGG